MVRVARILCVVACVEAFRVPGSRLAPPACARVTHVQRLPVARLSPLETAVAVNTGLAAFGIGARQQSLSLIHI